MGITVSYSTSKEKPLYKEIRYEDMKIWRYNTIRRKREDVITIL